MNTQQPPIYRHVEAFCLMEYASQDGKEVEFIWNSRDGVTPFIVRSRLGTELSHANWQRDRRIPDFRPQPGSRIFVDLTPERAHEWAQKYVTREWNRSGYLRMQDSFANIDEAIATLGRDSLQPGAPDIVVVPTPSESERPA